LKRAAVPVSINNHTKIVAPDPIKSSTLVSTVTAPKTPITTAAAVTTTTSSIEEIGRKKTAADPVSTKNHTKIVLRVSSIHQLLSTTMTIQTTPASLATTTTSSTADVNPFVNYTVVDGIPQFRVIFPPKNSSSNGSVNQSKTATSTSIVKSAVRSGSAYHRRLRLHRHPVEKMGLSLQGLN